MPERERFADTPWTIAAYGMGDSRILRGQSPIVGGGTWEGFADTARTIADCWGKGWGGEVNAAWTIAACLRGFAGRESPWGFAIWRAEIPCMVRRLLNNL